MAYSMIPVLTSVFPTDTTITNWCGTTLAYMQELAGILGDGFYAESVSLTDASIYSLKSKSTISLTGSIPFIKHPSWGNVGFTFNGETDSSSPSLYGTMFDFDTNSYVYNIICYNSSAGSPLYATTGLNVINAGPSLKTIYASNIDGLSGQIIFKDNLVISSYTTTYYGGNYYNLIASVYDTVEQRVLSTFNPILRATEHNYMQLAPISYTKGQHLYTLDDVFTMLISTDSLGNCSNRVSSGEVTYAYAGKHTRWTEGPFRHPLFVISNLYTPYDGD